MLRAVSQFLHSPGSKDKVRAFCKTCDSCQRCKNTQTAGHVPPRNESMVPFEQIAINTVGPWSCEAKGIEIKINACTITCTCSNLLELKRATQHNPTAKESVQVLEDTWLSRHPKPVRIICDQGSKHSDVDFKSFLISQGIKGVPCAVNDPQSNAILEQAHNVVEVSL